MVKFTASHNEGVVVAAVGVDCPETDKLISDRPADGGASLNAPSKDIKPLLLVLMSLKCMGKRNSHPSGSL